MPGRSINVAAVGPTLLTVDQTDRSATDKIVRPTDRQSVAIGAEKVPPQPAPNVHSIATAPVSRPSSLDVDLLHYAVSTDVNRAAIVFENLGVLPAVFLTNNARYSGHCFEGVTKSRHVLIAAIDWVALVVLNQVRAAARGLQEKVGCTSGLSRTGWGQPVQLVRTHWHIRTKVGYKFGLAVIAGYGADLRDCVQGGECDAVGPTILSVGP